MDEKAMIDLYKQLFSYCYFENRIIESEQVRQNDAKELGLLSNEKIYSKFKTLVLDLIEFKRLAKIQSSQNAVKFSKQIEKKDSVLIEENKQLKLVNHELEIKLEVLRGNLMESQLKLAEFERKEKERLSDVFEADCQKDAVDGKSLVGNWDQLVVKTKGFHSPQKVASTARTDSSKKSQTIKSVRFEFFGKNRGVRKEASLIEGCSKNNSSLNSPSKGKHSRSNSDVLIKLHNFR